MKELLIMAKSLGGGGSEVALIELINALPEELYNITLVLLDSDNEYVILLEDDSRPIYRMTLGGNNLQKIVDGTTQYMQIKNDRLYYCLMNAENESNYYSCDMDGTNQCKEIDKNIYYPW